MPAPKRQLQYKVGSDYYVEGVSERVRHLRFVGRATIDETKYLIFRPVRSDPPRKRKPRRRSN